MLIKLTEHMLIETDGIRRIEINGDATAAKVTYDDHRFMDLAADEMPKLLKWIKETVK